MGRLDWGHQRDALDCAALCGYAEPAVQCQTQERPWQGSKNSVQGEVHEPVERQPRGRVTRRGAFSLRGSIAACAHKLTYLMHSPSARAVHVGTDVAVYVAIG